MSERMTNNKIEKMYDRFTDDFLGELRTDEFFAFFMNALKSNAQKAFWIEGSLSTSKITSVNLTGLPKYPSSKGRMR